MLKNNLWLVFGIAVALLLILVGWRWWLAGQVVLQDPSLNHQRIPIQIDSKVVTIEIVNTPASMAQGLSGRREIGADGMLFVLEQPRVASFWMKDMLFNLDLVWLRDGEVVDITKDAAKPAPGQLDSELPVYTPDVPVDAILEVPAGAVDAWQVKVGSRLSTPDASLVEP